MVEVDMPRARRFVNVWGIYHVVDDARVRAISRPSCIEETHEFGEPVGTGEDLEASGKTEFKRRTPP